MEVFTDITLESSRLLMKRCHYERDAEEANAVILDTIDSLEPYVVWAIGTPTIQETKEALKRVTSKPNDYSFKIYLKDSPSLIGICGLTWSHDKYEVGYWLHKKYTRRGIMTEALETLFRFGKEKLGQYEFELHTHEHNIASVKLAGKFGFKESGFGLFSSHFRPEWGEYKLIKYETKL